MPRLPTLRVKDLIKSLLRQGFILDHISGSHHILRHPDKRKTTVPVHGNKEIPKGTLHAILKDLGISRESI